MALKYLYFAISDNVSVKVRVYIQAEKKFPTFLTYFLNVEYGIISEIFFIFLFRIIPIAAFLRKSATRKK